MVNVSGITSSQGSSPGATTNTMFSSATSDDIYAGHHTMTRTLSNSYLQMPYQIPNPSGYTQENLDAVTLKLNTHSGETLSL